MSGQARTNLAAILAGLVLAGAVMSGCGDSGDSGSGSDDKEACQDLNDAKGADDGIYASLYRKNLSGDLRTALKELEESTAGAEVRPDTFEKAGTVAALCAAEGVILSG